MRVLHAIHDFLPRHRAGSEIYAANLAGAQMRRGHHVTVLCGEYDPATRHGEVRWRVHDGLPVAEIVNNWIGRSFEDTYRSSLITERLGQVLDAVQPDALHIHSLLNLSFDLPGIAKTRGIPVVATLHDYTLVCPSGGQRVHRAENHVCETIDTERCARCFAQSPFYSQLSVGAIVSAAPSGLVRRAAGAASRYIPALTRRAVSAVKAATMVPVAKSAIDARLDRARSVFGDVDLFVAPSAFLAAAFVGFGLPSDRIEVSRNGHARLEQRSTPPSQGPLRIGFIGTIAWHKGVHVLIDALKFLPGDAYRLVIHGSLSVAPEYVSQLRRSSVGVQAEFTGEFNPSDLATVLAAIDVLVVPSLWPENAPLVIQEAFQAGVPVVASRIGGIEEFVADGVNGRLFRSGDSGDLGAILREIATQPQERVRLSAQAPTPRDIDEDAAGWDERYARVARMGAASGAAS